MIHHLQIPSSILITSDYPFQHEFGLTNGLATDPSKISNSSFENPNFGIIKYLTGTNNIIIIGNPIAAIVYY